MTIEILRVYVAMQGLCSYTTRSKEKKSLINVTAASRSVCLSSISFYVFAVMIFSNTRNSILIFFCLSVGDVERQIIRDLFFYLADSKVRSIKSRRITQNKNPKTWHGE